MGFQASMFISVVGMQLGMAVTGSVLPRACSAQERLLHGCRGGCPVPGTAGTPPSRVSCLHVGTRVPALLGLRVAAGAPAPPSVRVHGDVPDRFVGQPVHTYF